MRKRVYYFFTFYTLFFQTANIDLFHFFKRLKYRYLIRKNIYRLILAFRTNRLFVDLRTAKKKKSMISISCGMFIKYFEKKKAIKKTKAIKFLIAKYLRKIYILTKIKNTILFVKNNPTFLIEMLNLVNTPIIHKFYDPLAKKIIDEANNKYSVVRFLYFVFLENKRFSTNKTKKKGRVKRKILRKLTLKDQIVD